ncbi:hypothetical protein [Minwuia thermotolerans]|uniref:Uncharacterized protein n=1 Tax=Minwuia thermotolerans TaxID=2056226 RepID=A0A2M9G4R3_9PROT|nr:hypothetical protein [Minwuia thermotolerans]PJK29335.1 hypothetical protein CVT23_12080 [Minwuia thermotolerans]PJK30480.1 hypothetical protein CVT23_05915 [Minwuia thermotolerans]PJK30703.1 hypothetical protein CVT23_04865 [Minwuia thermotolerans]
MTETTRRRGGIYRREADDKPARLVKGSRTAPPADPAHRIMAEPAPRPMTEPAPRPKPAAAPKED